MERESIKEVAIQVYDAREVANLLLDLARVRGVALTQIALQKTLYFAHAWFLARKHRPLVDEQFEAWEYGPVIRSIYEQFRRFGDRPIEARATKLNFATGATEKVQYEFSTDEATAIERIFDFYSQYEPFTLVEMTHEPSGPWDMVYRSGVKTAHVGMQIPNSLIQKHFDIYYTEKLFN
jgi:uncharacterized phage-associated protein